MNICIFSGYIGNHLELKKLQDGTSVLELSLAVRRNQEKTDWARCVAYKEKADFIHRYFKKGSFIEVRSRLRVDEVEKDGQKRYYHNFIIQEVEFGGSKKESTEPDASSAKAPDEPDNTMDVGYPLIDISSDDFPF